jgi:hypothetical protein
MLAISPFIANLGPCFKRVASPVELWTSLIIPINLDRECTISWHVNVPNINPHGHHMVWAISIFTSLARYSFAQQRPLDAKSLNTEGSNIQAMLIQGISLS